MKLKLKVKIIENYNTYTGKNKFWLNLNEGDILEILQDLGFSSNNRGGIYTPDLEIINHTNNTTFKDKGRKVINILARHFKLEEI